MNKAIKYRIYPNAAQRELFAKTFGCCRKIWNLMLADKIEHYQKTHENLLTTPAKYKTQYEFLKEVDAQALCYVQMNLQAAYSNFFRSDKFRFPKFKSAKNDKKTYTTARCSIEADKASPGNGFIKFAKVGKVKVKLHRLPEDGWKLKSGTVSMTSDGKYYVSCLFEYDDAIPVLADKSSVIGLDYKSDGFYADSEGNICGSPKFFRKSQKELAKLQRRMARKTKGSSNYEKAKLKVAKLYAHIANQRKDFLHKKSTEIANQYDIVCIESLDMKAIANKGFHNGKATNDNGWGMFTDFLAYKLADRGKDLVKVDRFFPSSQICNACGTKHPEMKDLSKRTFVCECGYCADRDLNAARNIKTEGLAMLLRQ